VNYEKKQKEVALYETPCIAPNGNPPQSITCHKIITQQYLPPDTCKRASP